ncbi:MAG: hypothetical protein HY791_36790 [Deltaproteobacteria bacterium]|nr:hypothetical protein [Deltaproteobacteria bacterium]
MRWRLAILAVLAFAAGMFSYRVTEERSKVAVVLVGEGEVIDLPGPELAPHLTLATNVEPDPAWSESPEPLQPLIGEDRAEAGFVSVRASDPPAAPEADFPSTFVPPQQSSDVPESRHFVEATSPTPEPSRPGDSAELAFRRTIAQWMGIDYCTAGRLGVDERLEVRFEIEPDGRVAALGIESSRVVTPELRECLLAHARALRFPTSLASAQRTTAWTASFVRAGAG